MRCQEARQFIWPYLDSDLDDRTIFLITRHLEDCPSCAAFFAREGALEREIGARLRATGGDEDAALARALARAVSPPGRWRRRLAVTVAVAAAIVALVATLVFLPDRQGDSPLPDLVAVAAADYRKLIAGAMGPEVGGDEPAAVSDFFRQRLGIDVALEPLAADGTAWQVDGARLCHLGRARVGLLILRHGGAPVSLFLVPVAEVVKFPGARAVAAGRPRFEVPGGHGVIGFGDDGRLHCAIGDVSPETLEGLLVAMN